MAGFPATKRLYLTADRSRVVEQGDPAAAFLFKGVGATVTAAEAAQYGLSAPGSDEPTAAPEPDVKAMKGPPANKAMKGPSFSPSQGA